MKKLLKNKKGLTLVELLAVIVILGIVAAIAIPSIGKVIENSKKNADRASYDMIVDAATRYSMEQMANGQTGAVTRADNNIKTVLIDTGYLVLKSKNAQSNSLVFDSFSVSVTAGGAITVTVNSTPSTTVITRSSFD